MNCKLCPFDEDKWKSLESSEQYRKLLIRLFYSKDFDLGCLSRSLKLCSISPEDASKIICDVLEHTKTADIISYLKEESTIYTIDSGNIPQFSDLSICLYGVIDALVRANTEDVTYEKMGYLLRTGPRSRCADTKYGENQAKTAESLGLCFISPKHFIKPTPFGVYFSELSKEMKNIIAPKLALRIPLIQNYFIAGEREEYIHEVLSILKESTQKRRLPNIKSLIHIIEQSIDNGV